MVSDSRKLELFKLFLKIHCVGYLHAFLVGVLRFARCLGGGFATFQVFVALSLEPVVLLLHLFHGTLALGSLLL